MRAATTLIALSIGCSGGEVRVAHPPAAFAGFDTAVPLGEPVILDATRSADPDGDRLGYAWRLEARPAGSAAEIGDARAALASLTPDELGTYVVSLTVADGDFMSRDLVGITAVESIATSTAPLALRLAPKSCNADLDRIQEAPCGVSDRRIAVDPVMLVVPGSLADRSMIEWSFVRLPLGAEPDELSLGTPRGPLGEMTFVPPRPGEYWIGARLLAPGAASPLVVATVGVFDPPPPAAVRPLPSIEAPATAELGQIVLFDSRASYVPTSSTGVRPRRTWSLVADPSNGADPLTDVATGCPVDECRRLVPSAAGTYLVSLSISAGVTAVAALEVR